MAINDETEVKIAISTRFAELQSTISEIDQNATMCILEPFQNQHLNISCTPESDVECDKILALMRDLTEDMFVDRLLLDFHQSEINLDTFRLMLLDMIKNLKTFHSTMIVNLKGVYTQDKAILSHQN